MNVTFLIGNGFDLRLGLETRYVDMYAGYIESDSANQVIRDFKDTLQQDSPGGYKTWGDFEMAMARHARNFQTEDELIMCVRDFKEYMANHLQNEQKKFYELTSKVHASIVAEEMKLSLENFYKGQTPNVINEIEAVYDVTDINWGFISFNYTLLFDALLKAHDLYYKKQNPIPIHVHGKFDTDIVLGIDNLTQLESLPYMISKRGSRAFIKTEFNALFDRKRIEIAEQTIAESDVICIYGMSLGASDETWVEHLRNWLLADSSHHLIFFKYSTKQFSNWKRDEMMDEEDEQRSLLLSRMFSDDAANVENQVHIPINYDIFNFKNRINAELEKRPHFVGTPGKFTAPR